LKPYDLEELNLAEYKDLDSRWQNWQNVKTACMDFATLIFDQITAVSEERDNTLLDEPNSIQVQ
jgi:hypothetical protein